MDASRLAVWTRRRVALATGGRLASLLGWGPFTPAAAKKKGKRKKRCRKLGASCQPDGKKCCRGNTCAREFPLLPRRE